MLGIIVVDVQNDFSEVGALPIPHASDIISVINKLLEQLGERAVVVYSRDWHPLDHCSFTKNGGQWPVHCVQNSKGAELISGLAFPAKAVEIIKGFDKNEDSYSAFSGVTNDDKKTPLELFLLEKEVGTVYVMGLATDYCVKSTALDAYKLGFKTIFVENASKGVSEETTNQAITDMSNIGISFLKVY